MNENEKKQYLDENGMLFYTQRLKIVLDALLAQKANVTDLDVATGRINALDANKVDKVPGKGLSTNDLTDALVQKIDEAGRRATIDGYTIEGDLTKAELDIAAASDLLVESRRIDDINTNKIAYITATNHIISVTENPKLRAASSVVIQDTTNESTKKIFGMMANTGNGEYLLLTFKNRDELGLYAVDDETPIDLSNSDLAQKALIDSDVWYDTYEPLLQAYQNTDPSDFASASDFSALDADVYRKNETFTKAEVNAAIAAAIAGVTQISYQIVQELPAEGENGVIYLILYAQGPQGNIYQEWIWIANTESYETLGSTNQIDLSNYVTFDDIEPISNTEIESTYNRVFDPTRVNLTVNATADEEPYNHLDSLVIEKITEVGGVTSSETLYELTNVTMPKTVRVPKNCTLSVAGSESGYEGHYIEELEVITSDLNTTIELITPEDDEPEDEPEPEVETLLVKNIYFEDITDDSDVLHERVMRDSFELNENGDPLGLEIDEFSNNYHAIWYLLNSGTASGDKIGTYEYYEEDPETGEMTLSYSTSGTIELDTESEGSEGIMFTGDNGAEVHLARIDYTVGGNSVANMPQLTVTGE